MFKRIIQLVSSSNFIEWAGSIFAILGAILIALNIKLEIVAFCVYIISNILISIFAYRKKQNGILLMSMTFVIINVIGIIRWL